MSAELEVLDFENLIPDAVAAAFTANGFTAGNVVTVGSDPNFQKQRPRVEIYFKLSGEVFPQRWEILTDGSFRNAAYKGTLSISAVTAADADGKSGHAQFRARVRNLCAQLRA